MRSISDSSAARSRRTACKTTLASLCRSSSRSRSASVAEASSETVGTLLARRAVNRSTDAAIASSRPYQCSPTIARTFGCGSGGQARVGSAGCLESQPPVRASYPSTERAGLPSRGRFARARPQDGQRAVDAHQRRARGGIQTRGGRDLEPGSTAGRFPARMTNQSFCSTKRNGKRSCM